MEQLTLNLRVTLEHALVNRHVYTRNNLWTQQ